jgi:predicted O-methyltransferase YrrM
LEATAHVLAEGVHEKCDHKKCQQEEKKDDENAQAFCQPISYQDWIMEAQAGRNANWKFNVTFNKAPDTDKAPAFPHNTLFHDTVENYAMKNTSLSSTNVQVAAQMTMEQELFAPCMVGTLESQFLKMYTKTIKAKRILDIGTFTGMSAIAFAEGALSTGQDGVHVDTLEFDQGTAKAAQGIFDKCEPAVGKAITLHQGDAVAWMRAMAEQADGPTYDIIFIDADKDNYIAYYDLAMGDNSRRSLLSENGIILADNSLSALLYDEGDERRLALHRFNQYVKNDDRVEQVVLTMREGITMISRK